MAEQSLKDKTIKGIVWSSVERFSAQTVQFVVIIIIANMLEPRDFGLIGMLTVFLAISQAFIDSGFTQALVRKLDRTDEDCSTVFYFNFVVSLLLYSLLFYAAPYIALFYHEPLLCDILHLLGLVLIINALAIVQRSLYNVAIDFRTQAIASLTGAILSGIVGIYLAYMRFGVWALVWQQLINALLNTFILWILSSWRPIFCFSWNSFRELFGFGSKLMFVSLINTTYENLFALVIGKVFNSTSLGYYTQADRFTKMPSSNVTGIIQRVTYPVLCCIQNDDERLRSNYRQLLRMSAFVIFPLMCGMAGVAYPMVELLLGDKWEYAATLIIPLCFGLMWYPIHAINLNLLQVKGRSDLFLKLEIIKKTIGITVLVITIPIGVLFMCYSLILISIVSLVINTYYTGKLIKVGFWLQMSDLFHILLSSLLLFAISFLTTSIINNPALSLIVGLLTSAIFYCGVCYFFKFDEFKMIKTIMK